MSLERGHNYRFCLTALHFDFLISYHINFFTSHHVNPYHVQSWYIMYFFFCSSHSSLNSYFCWRYNNIVATEIFAQGTNLCSNVPKSEKEKQRVKIVVDRWHGCYHLLIFHCWCIDWFEESAHTRQVRRLGCIRLSNWHGGHHPHQ